MTEENKKTTKRFFGKIGNYVVNFSPPIGTNTTLIGFQETTSEEKKHSFQEEKQISELKEKIVQSKKDEKEFEK